MTGCTKTFFPQSKYGLKQKRKISVAQVRDQIKEKESHRIQQRNAFFEEGVKLDEEARNRRSKLDEIKRKKIQELRYVFYTALSVCENI